MSRAGELADLPLLQSVDGCARKLSVASHIHDEVDAGVEIFGEQAMFTHPHLSHQIASDRHREKIASTQQRQLARHLRAQARASRPAGRAAQRLRRSLRITTARQT